MRPSERVQRAFTRIHTSDRPEVWIQLRDEAAVSAEAETVERRTAAGESLPLAGVTVAVKDNIDVAGLPTTAGCPAYVFIPAVDAPAVARLRAAGALILGKTNLDQFATGLVGTRSPHGAVRDARDPARVSGGSSSGSAVAVALGQAELALGTDTAGSGRVPAAFQGVVGGKPTRGLIPVRGVVPACRSFDTVSVFADTVTRARTALELLAGVDACDPGSRPWPADAPLGAPAKPRVGFVQRSQLPDLSDHFFAAYEAATSRLAATGAELEPIDLEPFVSAGALLYGGAFIAERYAAVGAFIAAHRDEVDPVVAEIVLGAAGVTAPDYVADVARLGELAVAAGRVSAGYDALLVPTVPFQPTIAEVTADPIGVNSRLGRYTTFANLLDMCAYSVPAGVADGGCFGVTLLAPAFHDEVVADLAARFCGEPEVPLSAGAQRGGGRAVPLLVLGAHMAGCPLNGELTGRGGRLMRPARTAALYRFYALATSPAKPGLVRVQDGGGDSIAGELWALPAAGLAKLLAGLPKPMALGPVELDDGTVVTGFLCEPAALDGAREITAFGGWRAFLDEARPSY